MASDQLLGPPRAPTLSVRHDARAKDAIDGIGEQAWIPIEYPDAVFDEPSGRWIPRAEVAQIAFTAFAAGPITQQVLGRLGVRRIRDPL